MQLSIHTFHTVKIWNIVMNSIVKEGIPAPARAPSRNVVSSTLVLTNTPPFMQVADVPTHSLVP